MPNNNTEGWSKEFENKVANGTFWGSIDSFRDFIRTVVAQAKQEERSLIRELIEDEIDYSELDLTGINGKEQKINVMGAYLTCKEDILTLLEDSNKLNNGIENLEWCTLQENIEHSIQSGTFQRTLNKRTQLYAICHPEKKAQSRDNLCHNCYHLKWVHEKKIKNTSLPEDEV